MAESKKNYKELKQELESILAQLQHEDTDVDEAVELHKKGQKIIEELEKYLGEVAKKSGLDIKIKSAD